MLPLVAQPPPCITYTPVCRLHLASYFMPSRVVRGAAPSPYFLILTFTAHSSQDQDIYSQITVSRNLAYPLLGFPEHPPTYNSVHLRALLPPLVSSKCPAFSAEVIVRPACWRSLLRHVAWVFNIGGL
ncbi:hypothetical protein PTI98_000291 [Pleurotus ostreatus]|nr:hypothetical protein PTI98_000291 [Pleurotus ostreatus]